MSKTTTSYPILPLRNSVLFPGTIMPILIGRERSLALFDHLEESVGSAPPEIVLLTQKDPDKGDPGTKELHKVGTLARVLKIIKTPDDTRTAIVQGVSRVKLITGNDPEDEEGFFSGKFILLEDIYDPDCEETGDLFQELSEYSVQIIEEASDVPKETSKILGDIESPSLYCDFVAGNLDT